MKKRIIAAVCALAIALSVCVAVLTVDVSAATKTFEVGFARVDINPWEDPYDLNGDGSKGKIMQLPMQGHSDNMNRQSAPHLVDDNGDGVVGEGDGLFASCIAVTDDDGDTVLLYSVAFVSADKNLVDATRAGVVAALKEKGINIKLPAENIMIQGTHTHSSIALGEYKESYKNSTTTYELKDQNGDTPENPDTITAGEVYDNFSVWYPYLMDQMVKAGMQAIEDRAAATMSKGQIDAGDASGKVMNTVRHYTRVANSGEIYVRGSNFNSSNIGHKTAGDKSATVDSSGSAEAVSADDTMYCLKFDFGGAKAPIALVNWRAHSTCNDRASTYLNVSSDYNNRISYELSKSANGGYRSIFIQGAAGNVTPSSAVYGSWCGASTHTYQYTTSGNKVVKYTGNLRGNVYGEVLGQVAAQCLKNNMSVVDAGNIRVTNATFHGESKSYMGNTLAIRAAQTARTAGVTSYPFIYPVKVSENCYNNMSATQKGWYDSYSGGKGTYVKINADTYKGETYVIASKQHVTDIYQNDDETGRETIDLSAFMLGDHVAFVTAPGELFDRYNSNLTWNDLKGKTQAQFKKIMEQYNEWVTVYSQSVGGSYGVPFVMGYANDSMGYFPNSIAYEYCAGSKIAAIGSYESHVTELAKGGGEKILATYAKMLGHLVSEDVDNELYRTAYCPACEETVVWKGISNEYNNLGDPGLASGHYYLISDATGGQKRILSDAKVCFDLNGCTYTGNSRAFLMGNTGATLNIMDTSESQMGTAQGYGGTDKSGNSPWGGGTIYVGEYNVCNMYGGTLTQVFTDKSGASNGGVVVVRGSEAEFNMYDGIIAGGKAHWTGLDGGTGEVVCMGGNVYVHSGKFTMYDGLIADGVAQAHVVQSNTTYKKNVAYGGNIHVRSGSFTMYGGTVSGGQAISYTLNQNTAHSYGGNISAGDLGALNLLGGTVTGGSVGHIGQCVYLTEGSRATLSGDATVDQIYHYTESTPNVTVTGHYTGTAVIRNRKTVPTAAGTVMGSSDNAVINTTGLMAQRGEGLYTLVVSGDKLVIGTIPTCVCGQTAVVNQLTQAMWDAFGGNLPSGHYQLAEDITAQLDPNGLEFSGDVCLDLMGKDIAVTTGRLYKMLEGSSLKLYDTVGGGQVSTTGLPKAATRKEGGLLWVCANAQLELYGGTLTMDANTTTNFACRGGLIDVQGIVTIDGGSVTGGKVQKETGSSTRAYGGNIAIKSTGVVNLISGSITGGESSDGAGNIQVFEGGRLNVSGGTISDGTASFGSSVRISNGGKIALSGSGNVDRVLMYAGDLTISGAYTGSVKLYLADTVTANAVVGISDGANIENADIVVYEYPTMVLQVIDQQLVLVEKVGGVQVVDAQGNVIRDNISLQGAIDLCKGTENILMLTEDMDQADLTADQDLTVDLNGKQMSSPIAMSGGAKVAYMDSQTADYTVSDGIFTRLSVAMAENAVAADGYVKHVHEDGTVSFHKIDTEVEYINFKPEKAGLYYSSLFKGDVYAAMEVETFGVALSITDAPLSKDGIASHAQYSVFEGSLFQPGQEKEFASTVLVDIFHEDYSILQNRKNGGTIVYGNSYIKLKNGEYIYDSVKGVTLKAVIEYVNDNWNDFKANQEDVLALYEKFRAAMKTWDVDVIDQAYLASK